MSFLRLASSAENSEISQQLEVCNMKEEISEDEDFYSLERTCRTCSRNIHDNQMLLPIFETNLEFNTSPIEVIEEIHFGNLKIKLDDGLPQHICSDCMINLTNINSYRKECENNQLILSTYFRNKSKISSTEKIGRNSILKNVEIFQLKDETAETYKIEMNEIECDEEEADHFQTDIHYDNCIEEDGENSFVNVEEFVDDTHGYQNNEESAELTSNKNLIQQQRAEKKSNKISGRQRNKGIRKKIVQCPFCKNIFRNKSALELHRRKFHPKRTPSRNICPICNQVFKLASILNDHLKTHNVEKPFKCDICDKCFNTKLNLSRHKGRSHFKGDFECPICFRHLDTKILYNYHMKSHNPDKKFKCQYCEKSFMQSHHLANHERVHTGQKPFKCEVCGKAFRQERNLQLHSFIHTGARPYVCKTCGKGFRQRGPLVSHMRLHNGIKPYQCEICGKNFAHKPGLNIHLRIHTGEKPYKCDQCDRAFITNNNLKVHKYSKHGEPHPYPLRKNDVSNSSYSCPLCLKILKSSKTLQIHIKAHSEEKKFKCEQCDSAFKRVDALKTHFDRVHLKLKPFPCQYCDKAFASSGDRNIHMKRHNIHSNENSSPKTGNLNKVQYNTMTTIQQGSVLMTSVVDAPPGGSKRIEEYSQYINNVEVEVEVEV